MAFTDANCALKGLPLGSESLHPQDNTEASAKPLPESDAPSTSQHRQQMPTYSFLFSQLGFLHPVPIDLPCQPRQFGLWSRYSSEKFMSHRWKLWAQSSVTGDNGVA